MTTALGNNHHYQGIIFITPKETWCLLSRCSPQLLPPSSAPTTTNLPSVAVDLFWIFHIHGIKICGLWWLASYIQHDVFEVHPHCLFSFWSSCIWCHIYESISEIQCHKNVPLHVLCHKHLCRSLFLEINGPGSSFLTSCWGCRNAERR